MLRRFGAGYLIGRGPNTTDTPVLFGALQDIAVDVTFTNKELRGNYQFPEAIGRGEAKVTAKAKFGRVSASLYNSLFFGQALTAGQTLIALKESHAFPASTPFTVVIAPAGSGVFLHDEGVLYSATGLPLQRVASGSEAVGKYSVDESTGTYTFASGETGNCLISYSYTITTSGFTLAINNELQGLAPQFALDMSWPDPSGTGQQVNILYACVASKLAVPTKMGDFGITELDIDAFADSADRVALFSSSE